jgi:cytochrome b561
MKYSYSARVFHWLMALVIIIAFALAFYMTSLNKENENRLFFYSLHKSFGVLALIMISARIINRFLYKSPQLPAEIAPYIVKLAKITHFMLYLLMFITPVSGYLMSNYYGYNVKIFGMVLPNLVETNFDLAKNFSELHEIFAFSLLGLIIFHLLAVIKHHFIGANKFPIIKRML